MVVPTACPEGNDRTCSNLDRQWPRQPPRSATPTATPSPPRIGLEHDLEAPGAGPDIGDSTCDGHSLTTRIKSRVSFGQFSRSFEQFSRSFWAVQPRKKQKITQQALLGVIWSHMDRVSCVLSVSSSVRRLILMPWRRLPKEDGAWRACSKRHFSTAPEHEERNEEAGENRGGAGPFQAGHGGLPTWSLGPGSRPPPTAVQVLAVLLSNGRGVNAFPGRLSGRTGRSPRARSGTRPHRRSCRPGPRRPRSARARWRRRRRRPARPPP